VKQHDINPPHMKLLFFSPVDSEVVEVEQEFLHAGIPCEVRHAHRRRNDYGEAEVWIRNDRDSHRALMLCVQMGVGFAKRPTRKSAFESWSDLADQEEADNLAAEQAEQMPQELAEMTAPGHREPRHRVARHRH
jgi:hypothetical protein